MRRRTQQYVSTTVVLDATGSLTFEWNDCILPGRAWRRASRLLATQYFGSPNLSFARQTANGCGVLARRLGIYSSAPRPRARRTVTSVCLDSLLMSPRCHPGTNHTHSRRKAADSPTRAPSRVWCTHTVVYAHPGPRMQGYMRRMLCAHSAACAHPHAHVGLYAHNILRIESYMRCGARIQSCMRISIHAYRATCVVGCAHTALHAHIHTRM